MAAAAIENKSLRSQRSASHAGLGGETYIISDRDDSAKLATPESSSSSSVTTSVSALNMKNNNQGFSQPFHFDDNLSFHPLKSYKTGKISESSLSIMTTEIGPVFTSNEGSRSSRKIANLSTTLLDSKPIRASKSTLDLPNLGDQDFRSVESEKLTRRDRLQLKLNSAGEIDNDARKRHRSSASPSPSTTPIILLDDENYAPFEKGKPKRRLSTKGKKSKEKESKTSPLSPNAKRKHSSPGKSTPELTVEKSFDEVDDESEEPRIGSWEWCRLRRGSAISGLICTGEIGPAIAVGLNIGSSIVTSNGIPITSEQLLSDATLVPIPVPVLPMTIDPSDSSDTEVVLDVDLRKDVQSLIKASAEPIIHHEPIDSGPESIISTVPPVCPVDHTVGKQMLNTVIPCNIDQLFTMLFTNSKFYLDFQLARKTCDINQSDWQLGDGSQKTRQLTFTVLTGQSIGPKQAQVTETQVLLPASRPGLLYAIQSESVNAGIPYADVFSVNCHYCLSKLSSSEARLVVTSKINYKKSTWAKPFIEKNSMAAMVSFYTHMEKALKEECVKMSAGGVTPTSPIASNLPRRRHPQRKKHRAPDIPASAMTRPNVEGGLMHSGARPSLSTIASDALNDVAADSVESSFVMKIILTVLGCLVLLNAFLYFKLSYLEMAATNTSIMYPPPIKFSGETPQTHQEWLVLLQHQETLHRSEVHGWHEILVSAIKILHQAEKDLEHLKVHISKYGQNSVFKPGYLQGNNMLSREDQSDVRPVGNDESSSDHTPTQRQPVTSNPSGNDDVR